MPRLPVDGPNGGDAEAFGRRQNSCARLRVRRCSRSVSDSPSSCSQRSTCSSELKLNASGSHHHWKEANVISPRICVLCEFTNVVAPGRVTAELPRPPTRQPRSSRSHSSQSVTAQPRPVHPSCDRSRSIPHRRRHHDADHRRSVCAIDPPHRRRLRMRDARRYTRRREGGLSFPWCGLTSYCSTVAVFCDVHQFSSIYLDAVIGQNLSPGLHATQEGPKSSTPSDRVQQLHL